MSSKTGPKRRHEVEMGMGRKGEAKPQRTTGSGSSGGGRGGAGGGGGAGNLSRRAKKRANEQQKLRANATRTASGDGGEDEGTTPILTSSKRYQSSRQQSATQKRERSRKLFGEAVGGEGIARAGADGLSAGELALANLPEDMRISRLLRRLASEQSVRGCFDLCDRLQLVILDPPNSSYVRKSFDLLSNTLVPILETGPRECHDRIAQLFGMMLYVVVSGSHDLTPFRNWTCKWLWQTNRLRNSMLVALRQTLVLDRHGNLQLEPFVGELLGELQKLLEETDGPDIFVLVTDIMVGLSAAYPESFEPYFKDVVDIVVGWQLETAQSNRLKLHCARVLQAFQPYWLEQREVTLSLLDQFVEDIQGCWDELDEDDREQWRTAQRLSATLLTAFNSVFKCLHVDSGVPASGRRPTLGGGFDLGPEDRALFESAYARIMVILSTLLEAPTSELPLAAISEFLMLRLSLTGPTDAHEEILAVIEHLLDRAASYSDAQLGSLLHLLLRYVETDGSEQQQFTMALLPLIMRVNAGGFYAVRFRCSKPIQQALLVLYHRMLTFKNVALLQHAYGLVLDDLDDALAQLRRQVVGSTQHQQAQYRISFNLLVLSPLAMARNSIFITWTLQERPVLHVLLERLALLDAKLWASYGQLHHAVLLVAYHHCTANNNFVSSSNLLQAKSYGGTVDRFLRLQQDQQQTGGSDAVPSASPTADHFGLVLRFLGTLLGEWTLLAAAEGVGGSGQISDAGRDKLLELLLDWCLAIVTQTERYHDVLQECADFNRLLTLVCTVSVDRGSASERIGLRCASCLDAVCQYASLHPAVYQAIAEACCVHLCSVYGSLRTRYTVIFSRLPLRHSLRQVNAFTGANRRRREEIRELKNVLYQSTSTELRHQQSAVLRMADLRALLNRVAFSRDGSAYVGEYLHELLTRSYNQPSAYGEMALRDLRCLIPWAQWEAAQLCVNHKLRTPFGKPQATFLRIESIVKQCARILALSDRFPVRDIRTSIANQRHARILLGFLEALEKSIYNAAEGTAYALPAPEKPARTFFRVNAPTCAEWFTRIRTAVDLVALHCMEPEMVIRYSEAVLRELVTAGKTSDLIFEHMLMSLVWALLRNWESDALYGVYVWSKQLTGRKYTWIRMAAEEAAGHRETAAEGFRAILADPAGAGMDRHIRDFIVDQTILSVLFTGDYRQLYEFLRAEETGGTPRATIPLITITAEQVHSIIRYEETHDVSVIDISQWELVDVGVDIPNDFSCHKMICAVENSLSGIILQEQIEQRERMIEASTELIQCYLQECLLTKCHEYLFQLTITNHILYKIAQRTRQAQANATGTDSGPLRYDDGIGTLSVEKFYGTLTLMRLLAWSEFLLANSNGGTGYEGEQQNIDLRLDMVSIGRKEKNYALCRRELEKYYHKSNLAQRLRTLTTSKPTLEQVAAALTDIATASAPTERLLWADENLSRAIYEHCKWLYCQPGKRLEAIDFAACATAAINDALTALSLPDGGTVAGARLDRLDERTARFMLTLGDWLSSTSGPEAGELSQATLQLASVQRLGDRLPVIDSKPLAPDHASQLGACDVLVGSLLQGASNRCPSLAKAWFQLGSWLYRWGKRVVELSSGASSARISVEQVAVILTDPLVTQADCERIVAILNEHEPGRTGDERVDDLTEDGELDLDSSATIGSIGLYEALQSALPSLARHVPPDRLHAIIDVWRSNHRAVYGYYEAAAAAYFRFLQLSTLSPRASGPADDGTDSERARSVTVTLRLLRLIVKHALGLKEVLEEGLATTPSEPWRVITPQLFSRLAHHEPYVRRRVSELLCRVAKDAPHLIIFPAVVGSVHEEQPELTNVVNVLLEGGEAAADNPDGTAPSPAAPAPASGLAFCFNALLDILSREVPDTVKQVQTLVHELRRISLLWEELWLVSLQQIYADYGKRVAAFESAYARQQAAGQLSEPRRALLAEKHRLLLRPLIFVLEQLYAITSRAPETNHERHFQERYHRYIRSMLEKLRAPADFSRPIEGWERFRALYTQLQTRSQKRFAFFLRLADVSPNLQQLSHTAIAMPGIDTTTVTTGGISAGGGPPGCTGSDASAGHGHRQSILIRSVDGTIQILPTKTRPKKLLFHGNDGRRYGYLSKGLEDLHLDERIMQFLSIANLMMTSSIDCNGNVTHYRAEHYSVIPLGPRSGLITWVDNTVPIFSLYKKWQQREALQHKENKESGGGGGKAGGGVLRPSELFYQKLNPLLHSHGMKSSDSRREWPLAALKQVLAELQQATPRDLLAKELWCHSATASSWRQVVRTYSLSLAVMSVIGYIIGLGDRHLDNVLVKLATGEIVHIDYNVCFEKGKTLRVPEKVPFRMTPNLEEALGMTGIEGTFRLACEHVLKSLKKGRETLLTLLEAFVYDPLVDWAISEEAAGGVPMTATEITVSTMSAATGPVAVTGTTGGVSAMAVSSLATTPATSSAASKYISQAKQQLDREVTRDTLAVRFAECRVGWQQNRDELLQQLLSLQKVLADQQAVRGELREAEQLRSSLSQQLQLIGEAEYLDTAFGSHPLATLAHRLSVRARVQEEYGATRNLLAGQAERLRRYVEQYGEFRGTFETDRLAQLQREASRAHWQLPEHSPSLIAFLAAQPSDDGEPGENVDYVRYCCVRTELSELQRRAEPVAVRIVQLLEQYGELAELIDALHCIPPHTQCTLARYTDWYARLAQPDQNPSAALATLQQVQREQQQFLKATDEAMDQLHQTLDEERTRRVENRLNVYERQSVSCIPYEEDQDTETEMENLCELASQTVCFKNYYHGMNETAASCTAILLYFATAQRIISMNSNLLFAESCLLDETSEVSTHFVEKLWTLVRHIRQQCERLVYHDLSDPSVLTLGYLDELHQVGLAYDALQRLHERIEQDAFLAYPNIPIQDSTVAQRQLLERAIDRALQREPVHTLLGRWIEPSVSELNRLLEGASSFVPPDPALPIDADVPAVDQAREAIKLQRLSHASMRTPATTEELEAQTVQLKALVAEAANDGGDRLRLALLPLRRTIVKVVRARLAGRLPLAAARLIYESLPTAVESSIGEHPHGLEKLCRVRCVGLLGSAVQFEDQLDQLKMVADRYNGLIFTEAGARSRDATNRSARQALDRAQMSYDACIWMLHTAMENSPGDREHPSCVLRRAVVLKQLRDATRSLEAVRPLLQVAMEQLVGCSEVLRNRLAWATAAHPPLCPAELLAAFEQRTVRSVERVVACLRTCELIASHASAVLMIEETRIDREDSVLAKEFSSLLERWQKLLNNNGLRPTFVSPTEEALVELLDPEGSIDHTWIRNVRALIDDMTDQALTRIAQLEQESRSLREAVLTAGRKLHSLTLTHNTIAGDIRSLLRTQLRIGGSPALRDYLQRYRRFLDLLQDVREGLQDQQQQQQQQQQQTATNTTAQATTPMSVTDGILTKVDELIALLPDVFEQLFAFERPEDHQQLAVGSLEEDAGLHTDPARQRATDSPTTSGGAPDSQQLDRNQKQKEQKRNAYAVSVWRRIRMKLEGRDPDPARRYTIPEQVSWMIQEAMDPNNLAVLYEGWTPWV
ncbi:serine/threonine-protein kinase Smg1-like [Anopheles ziemanni]|uniref:serine/threonine-protein kinase Smg1-like n=1 Tax=Anopheles coustani TaxID=139045 RepID=UPI002659EFBB|nr:serine/threonine-protein kinase Smg1-like [Anopheles coustani]XP_058176168.1 serine/threonine-protein kinase Smg1-like [Anopheles ziemanni]